MTVDALLAANAQILDPRLLQVGDAVTISPMDLGTLRGRRSTANDINERGEIVGQSETELGEPLDPTSDLVPMSYEAHAFIWRDGVMTDLGTLGGWRSSATSLNEHGEVVGTSDAVLDFGATPFLWRDGVIASVWFGSFSAGGTRPAINDLGQIALTVAEPDPEDPAYELRRAFLWENGRTTPLGSVETGALAEAADLNNRGEVVGRSGSHAALWSDGIVTDLGTLGGKTSSANAINDRGQVVGWSDTNAGNTHAFLWQNGTMTDLGTLGGDVSHATGLNDRGQVVGWSYTASGHTRAFLWQDGTMRDLGTLAGAADSPDFGPTDVTAAAINDCGEIVGSDHRPVVEDGHALMWFAPSR